LARLRNLENHYVRDTKVTADGVAELQKALPKCKERLSTLLFSLLVVPPVNPASAPATSKRCRWLKP
jgi:hypothetical protein